MLSYSCGCTTRASTTSACLRTQAGDLPSWLNSLSGGKKLDRVEVVHRTSMECCNLAVESIRLQLRIYALCVASDSHLAFDIHVGLIVKLLSEIRTHHVSLPSSLFEELELPRLDYPGEMTKRGLPEFGHLL